MKRTTILLFLFFATGFLTAGEKAPEAVKELTNSKLVDLGSEAVIVNAVKAQNAKRKTLSQIKEFDKKWISTPGIADFMKELMNSECGKYLQKLEESEPYFVEIFVVDNQGANVAISEKTSDYWQGDEAKFTECYKGGHGVVYIGDVEFDDSSQAYLVQVSVPVVDNGKTIGVLVIGIDVDSL